MTATALNRDSVESFLRAHPGKDFFVPGARLHYIDEGQGEPLIMLHGNPTWSYMYRHLIDNFSDRHRVIAVDHVGCGMSEKPGDDRYEYTLERRVEDLESLLDHLNLTSNLTLICHDWGGMIGMTYAVRNPERIARLVLMNTSAFFLPKSKPFPTELTYARSRWLGGLLVRGLNLFCKGAINRCSCEPLSDEVRQGLLYPYGTWKDRIAVHRFVQDIPIQPSDRSYHLVQQTQEGLAKFSQTPLLICWGEQDFIFDQHFLNEWVRRTPHAEILHLDHAGHYLLEDALEEVQAKITEFLQANPVTAAVR